MYLSTRVITAAFALAALITGTAFALPAVAYELRWYPEYDGVATVGALVLLYLGTRVLTVALTPRRTRARTSRYLPRHGNEVSAGDHSRVNH